MTRWSVRWQPRRVRMRAGECGDSVAPWRESDHTKLQSNLESRAERYLSRQMIFKRLSGYELASTIHLSSH
jgi:hypothetical protein